MPPKIHQGQVGFDALHRDGRDANGRLSHFDDRLMCAFPDHFQWP